MIIEIAESLSKNRLNKPYFVVIKPYYNDQQEYQLFNYIIDSWRNSLSAYAYIEFHPLKEIWL